MYNNTTVLYSILGIIVGAIFTLFGVHYYFTKQSLQNESVSQRTDIVYRVAILLPVSHPSLEEIKQGFIETLKKKLDATYDVYNANGNRILLRNQAEDIVHKNYDLVFTIATGPALIMKEVTAQRGNPIPIVASAVEDPIGIKLIKSMENSDNNLTVITQRDEFEKQMEILMFLKPKTKNILLVYNPACQFERIKLIIEKICQLHNKKLNVIQIFNLNDISQKVPSLLAENDTVLVLKDNFVVSGIESLINICNRANVTLYVSDLNSVDKGAALGFAIREYDDGVEGANKAFDILKNNIKPAQIPSTQMANFIIKLNTQTMTKQGLSIDEKLLFLMKSSEVI